jgi:hypothetical protein
MHGHGWLFLANHILFSDAACGEIIGIQSPRAAPFNRSIKAPQAASLNLHQPNRPVM